MTTKLKRLDQLVEHKGKDGELYVVDLNVYVSGYLEGGLDDWPSNIQDGIHKAVEELAQKKKLSLVVVHSTCQHDGLNDKWYLHCVISEIVQVERIPKLLN